MKLEPLFTVKENSLFTIQGNPVNLSFTELTDIKNPPALAGDSFYKIVINQKTIEPEDESYNEEFLAELRDFLKQLDEKKQTAVLSIIPYESEMDAESAELYTACVKHTARRVKDCISVAGVFIESALVNRDSSSRLMMFEDELLLKHQQYVFFARKTVYDVLKGIEQSYLEKIVLI